MNIPCSWIVLVAALTANLALPAQDFDALLEGLKPHIEANHPDKASGPVAQFKAFVLNEQKALEQRVAVRAAAGLPAGKPNLDREAELKRWLADADALLHTFEYARNNGLSISGSDFLQRSGEQRIFKKDVLAVTPDAVVWTTDGSTRVDRDTFHLPAKVWETNRLRYVLEAETGWIDRIEASGRVGISLSQAANEYESFHLVVTPKSGDLQIPEVRMSDLRSDTGGVLSASNAVFRYIGEVSGFKPGDDLLIGPYPDVLFPLSYDTTAERGKNYALYCTLFVPSGTAPGRYAGAVSLQAGPQTLSLPVAVNVYPIELPKTTTVNTMLMGMWLPDMDYHYGLEPWSAASQQIKKEWAEQMAALRFSPSTIPLIPRIRWEEFPVQADGVHGKGLMFGESRSVTIAGPKFEELGDGFTLMFYLKKTGETDPGSFFNHRWSNRPSGYGFSLQGGRLSAQLGIASEEANPDEVEVSTVSAVAEFPADREWHHVALRVISGNASLYLNGVLVAEKELENPLSPAYGQVTLAGGGFAVDELRWSRGGTVRRSDQRRGGLGCAAVRHAFFLFV